MNSKYGNNQPPLQIGRIPTGFYLDNGVPRAVIMILPSPESIDRLCSSIVNSGTFQGIKMLLSDIKRSVLLTIVKDSFSPFPIPHEIDNTILGDFIDFIEGYEGGIDDEFLHGKILEIKDFLAIPGSQIYPVIEQEIILDTSSGDDHDYIDYDEYPGTRNLRIHCYRNGVYHNQLDYTFDAFTLYLEMYDNQES